MRGMHLHPPMGLEAPPPAAAEKPKAEVRCSRTVAMLECNDAFEEELGDTLMQCETRPLVERGRALAAAKVSGEEEEALRAARDVTWATDLDSFVRVYTQRIQRVSSTMARQLEKAFAAFDETGSGVMAQSELRRALSRMASAPLDDARLDQVLREVAGDDDKKLTGRPITIGTFSHWMMRAYTQQLSEGSYTMEGSLERWPDFVYNQ